jgi:hypothetical protein
MAERLAQSSQRKEKCCFTQTRPIHDYNSEWKDIEVIQEGNQQRKTARLLAFKGCVENPT